MWDMITLKTIGTMVVVASLGSLVSRKLKVPHIVLYLASGLILGGLETTFLKAEELREAQSSVHIISQAGIALLLFLVGMELSLSKIKDVGKDALMAGGGQVLASSLGGFALAYIMGFEPLSAFALATAMTFSSTVIVVKLIGENRHLNTLYGRMAIGILLVQDLVVVLELTVLSGMREAGSGPAALGAEFGKALFGVAALFIAAFYLAKHVLGPLMSWASASTETLLVWCLAWCFAGTFAAHLFGLSHEIGAFLAGVSLAQLPLSNSLKERAKPLMNFFMGIFFIALGLEIDLSSALNAWRPALGFILFVWAGKGAIFLIVMARRGFPERTSFLTAVSMAQISEFSFIFIAMAKELGLAGQEEVSIVALTGLATFVSSSFVISRNQELYRLFSRRQLLYPFRIRPKTSASEFPERTRSGHIVIVGMNSLGRELALKLSGLGYSVLAVDNDPKKLKGLPCETFIGDAEYSSLLEEASFENALLAITTLRIEDVNMSLVYRCKKLGLPVAAHGFESSVAAELRRLGADYVIDSRSSWLKRLVAELEARKAALP